MQRVLPILFNTDMVRAILREVSPKTATRRVIKGYIPNDAMFGYTMFTPKGCISCRGTFADEYGEKFFKLPCQKGDILFVRETWAFQCCIECRNLLEDESCMIEKVSIIHEDKDADSEGCYIYRADHPDPARIIWRPSIHMPKQAARIWLEVKDVRVERLHDMTLDDFLSEGVVIRPESFNDPENAYMQARSEFARIWDSTIKKSQIDIYGWEANPWVLVNEFKRCENPESEG